MLVQVLRNGQYSRVELVRQTAHAGPVGGNGPGTDVSPVQEATYFAIDANGNTSSANNKGPGYIPLPADRIGGAAALVFSPAAPSASGWFLTQPSVAAAAAGLPRAGRRDGHAAGVGDGHRRRAHGVRLRSRRARS